MEGFSISEIQQFLVSSEANEQECRNRKNFLESSIELKQLCEMNGVTKKDFVQKKESLESLQIFMTNPIEISLVRFFPCLQTLQVKRFCAWGEKYSLMARVQHYALYTRESHPLNVFPGL